MTSASEEPDFEAFERSAHERAARAQQREDAATARAVKARPEAAAATHDVVREEREREARTHERAAAAQHVAVDFQHEHAEHSRRLAERRAAEPDIDD